MSSFGLTTDETIRRLLDNGAQDNSNNGENFILDFPDWIPPLWTNADENTTMIETLERSHSEHQVSASALARYYASRRLGTTEQEEGQGLFLRSKHDAEFGWQGIG
jgi:hypothetical protein